MGFEKRRSPRKTIHVVAMMANIDGSLIGLCTTIDMSATGARLEPRGEVEAPDKFLLVLSRDGRIMRRCKTVWRAGKQVGVQFVADRMSKRVEEIRAQQAYRACNSTRRSPLAAGPAAIGSVSSARVVPGFEN